jgi:hypothetical protein
MSTVDLRSYNASASMALVPGRGEQVLVDVRSLVEGNR